MKAVFPTNSDLGLSGSVYGHFGSAPFFILADTETMDFEVVANQDLHHLHGQCQPLKALGGASADAVVVGGIGKGALNQLLKSGMKVFRAVEGSVKINLELLTKGTLPEFSMEETCAGHGEDGLCSH